MGFLFIYSRGNGANKDITSLNGKRFRNEVSYYLYGKVKRRDATRRDASESKYLFFFFVKCMFLIELLT